mgnify:CR=1 FL=1
MNKQQKIKLKGNAKTGLSCFEVNNGKSFLEEKTHNFNVKQNRYMIKCYTEFERCHCESSEKEEVVWTDVVGECIEGEV